MKNLIPALICLFLAIPCQAGIIYVDDDADVSGEGRAAKVSGASMIFKSAGSLHDVNGWNLSGNGYLGTFTGVDDAGPVTFTIKADGSIANGALPIMDLHVADYKSSWTVADNGAPHETYSDYVAMFDLPAGMHALRVEFTNDYYDGSEDRNLYIKSISVDGGLLENTLLNALAAADTYIQNYRVGPATVTVHVDGNETLPEGTPAEVRLRRHAFDFGTAVYGTVGAPWATPDPPLGTDHYNYQQFLDSHFNMLVPENTGKWAYNEEARDEVTMGTVDTMLDYADAHGLRARMHTVLWDNQQPTWVEDLKNQALTDPCAAAEYWDEIMERIQYYIGERAGGLTDIDGINESYHKSMHTRIYGIDGVADLYNEMAAASAGRIGN